MSKNLLAELADDDDRLDIFDTALMARWLRNICLRPPSVFGIVGPFSMFLIDWARDLFRPPSLKRLHLLLCD